MIVVHDANAIIEDTTADEIIWFWYNQYDAEEPVMSTFTAIASSNLYRWQITRLGDFAGEHRALLVSCLVGLAILYLLLRPRSRRRR
jgi:hypothetical protein